VQFRELEFRLGIKDEALLKHLLCEPAEVERLRARLSAPSVSDALDAVLVRRGLLDAAVVPPERVRSREVDGRVVALVKVYEAPEQYPGLAELCETLVEIDECLALWRAHHVLMVERMIGAKRGTGGSEGVAYLQSTQGKRAFPDLWRARTHLGQDRS
jgi:tryptophan 2,3-dioxygenase